MDLTKPINELGIASIPAINQYLQLAYDYKLDINTILNNVDIDASELKDNSNHIDGIKFQALISELINLSKDELYGLHTAKYVQPGSYSVLGFISMNCQTLGEAITKIQPFEKLVGDMGTTTIENYGNDLSIRWNCIYNNKLVKRHMIDNVLASWLTFARYLVGIKRKPIKILLSRETPTLSIQDEYQSLFGCLVEYQQPVDAIVFDLSLLSTPLNKGDKQLLTTLEFHANTVISNLSSPLTLSEEVEKLIKANLRTGKYHLQDIADLMNISGKTLQRRLQNENSSYQKKLDFIRLEKAKYFLINTSLSLTQISAELGFVESRSFYRWFNKIEKITPGEYRKHNGSI